MSARLSLLLAAAVFAFASPAGAATFTVNDAGDAGDLTCDATCTLRDAIDDANANGNPGVQDEIQFSFPGQAGTPVTIAPTSALPDLTESVLVDGRTHTGAPGGWGIFLDGSGVASTDYALDIRSTTPVTIRGLALGGFTNGGALLSSAGIGVVNTGAAGHVIEDDAIGLRADGETPAPFENMHGITTLLAGGTIIRDNVIGGAEFNGINVDRGSTDTLIRDNRIGTTPGGASVPNVDGGIRVRSIADGQPVERTTIRDNLVAGNGRGGIFTFGDERVTALERNAILGNAVTYLGIDLGRDGKVDPIDADGIGDVRGQNRPELASAGGGEVRGTLTSEPGGTY
ncbi:MAG: right-handed parallel beta-helix repeat-containing protein, partial [Solirubrobacterales bacterium]|nr:right-handed parallel beta-helix repeat-containing protein [Solirubrobacterales bacterium]